MNDIQIVVLHTYKDWAWVQVFKIGEEPGDPVTHSIEWLESYSKDNNIPVFYA